MVLVQKWPIFQLFFFRQCRPGKCLLRYSKTEKRLDHILERKNAFLASKNQKIKKSKIDIVPKGLTQGFGSKLDNFSSSVF